MRGENELSLSSSNADAAKARRLWGNWSGESGFSFP
jgi:hypothetical protein